MRTIDGDGVQEMAATAQLVEVLPAEAYDGEHLPGAINVPLNRSATA